MNPLLAGLNQFLPTVAEKIPNLNVGGCCVFAAHLGQHLEDYGNVSIRILGRDFAIRDLITARKHVRDKFNVREWQARGLSFHHVVVQLTQGRYKYYIDSSGVHPVKDGYSAIVEHCCSHGAHAICEGYFTVLHAQYFANKPEAWHHAFDRRNIPTMKKLIDNWFTNPTPAVAPARKRKRTPELV